MQSCNYVRMNMKEIKISRELLINWYLLQHTEQGLATESHNSSLIRLDCNRYITIVFKNFTGIKIV